MTSGIDHENHIPDSNLRRTSARMPYDGITPEVNENKGPTASKSPKLGVNRSISGKAANFGSFRLLSPNSELVHCENEGDSGEVVDKKGWEKQAKYN